MKEGCFDKQKKDLKLDRGRPAPLTLHLGRSDDMGKLRGRGDPDGTFKMDGVPVKT